MTVIIKIDCDVIGELNSHLSELRRQIKKTAKKEKLNPDENSLVRSTKMRYMMTTATAHTVTIFEDGAGPEELFKRAEELMITLLPVEDFGESYEAEELYNILKTLAGVK